MTKVQIDNRDIHTIQVDSAMGAMKLLEPYRRRLSALGVYVEMIRPGSQNRKIRGKGVLRLTEPERLKSFLAKLDRL